MTVKLPEGFTARAAAAADAPAVAACVNAAYEHYVARNGLIPGPMRDDYGQIIADHDDPVIHDDGDVVDDGVVVGVLVLKIASEGFLLDNVAVLPSVQGKGVGRFLLERAEDKALHRGFDSIYLYTQEIMTENRALYERLGYVEYARRRELGLRRIYMRKALTGPQSL